LPKQQKDNEGGGTKGGGKLLQLLNKTSAPHSPENSHSHNRVVRRASRKSFRRFSTELGRRKSTLSSSLDGKFKRSSGANTEILQARERINQYQRVNNDRSINIMLITVSVSFLVLTFPYQLVWLCDQVYREFLNKKLATENGNSSSGGGTSESDIQRHVFVYQLVSFSTKDIALTLRNFNFSINFFLYSTMSNLFRKELNCLFQNIGFSSFKLFRNSLSTSTNPEFVILTNTARTTNRSRLFSYVSSGERNIGESTSQV
jgi:hypothetical protein